VRYHEDARRRFWGDIFELASGDINLVRLNPGAVIAWHRHQNQDDRIWCVSGEVLVQAIYPSGRMKWYLSARDDSVAMILRNSWHGYSSPEGATILQFNSPGKWDGTDEERHPIDDEMPWTS
jgi:quercetin dioxygenase-like cupin family protein